MIYSTCCNLRATESADGLGAKTHRMGKTWEDSLLFDQDFQVGYQCGFQIGARVNRTRMTRVERIDADPFRFYRDKLRPSASSAFYILAKRRGLFLARRLLIASASRTGSCSARISTRRVCPTV